MYCLYISVQRVFDGSMNPDEGMVAIFSWDTHTLSRVFGIPSSEACVTETHSGSRSCCWRRFHSGKQTLLAAGPACCRTTRSDPICFHALCPAPASVSLHPQPPTPTLHPAAVYLPDLSYCLVCHLQSLALRAALTGRGISCLCLVLRAGLSRWIGQLCTNATGKHVMTHTGTLPPTAAAPHGATVRVCIFVYPRGRPVNSMQDNITCRLCM